MSVPNSSAPARPSLLRRFRVPLAAVALPALLYGVLWTWELADLDPAPLLNLFMAFQFAVMLALVVIPVWFLIFSGYTWRTKAGGVAAVALLFGAFRALVRKVEFT